jgi:hypothetical protein
MKGLDHGVMFIENENKRLLTVSEDELFNLVDNLFKSKTKE